MPARRATERINGLPFVATTAQWYIASTMWTNRALSVLDRAVGVWNVTGKHPYLPGRTLRGRVTFERNEGGAFVRMRSKMEDPEIPEGIAIFGTDEADDACTMSLRMTVKRGENCRNGVFFWSECPRLGTLSRF